MNRDNHAAFSTPEELAFSFNTDLDKGLDWHECETRLATSGLNEFKPKESSQIVYKYLEQFKNPLIQLLLASVIISVFMAQYDDAISISLVSSKLLFARFFGIHIYIRTFTNNLMLHANTNFTMTFNRFIPIH